MSSVARPPRHHRRHRGAVIRVQRGAVIALVIALALGTLAVPGPVTAEIPSPIVTGPIPATAPPGDPSRNYPFFATNHDLARWGYIEEEFFIEGTANRYTTPSRA